MFSSPTVRTSFIFVAVAIVGLLFADIAITASNPWRDLGNFFLGVLTPNFFSSEGLMTALLRTVAFAFVGVALGSVCGFLLSLVYRFLPVRIFCAFIRAIHELFWALIFRFSSADWCTGNCHSLLRDLCQSVFRNPG